MTEPVAYYKDFSDGTRLFFKSNELCDIDNSDNLIKPLYTKEQLQPRVKMTKKQYDRLMWDKQNTDLLNCLGYVLNSDGNHFGLSSEDLRGDLTQEDIARAWLDNETIEIVLDMKWFVRSKAKGRGKYLYLKEPDESITPWYTAFKDMARHFDTEEEAKLWTTPDTEAVQLPVEGE